MRARTRMSACRNECEEMLILRSWVRLWVCNQGDVRGSKLGARALTRRWGQGGSCGEPER